MRGYRFAPPALLITGEMLRLVHTIGETLALCLAGALLGGFAALAFGWLVADVSDGKGTLYLSGGGIIGVVVTAIRLRSHVSARPSEALGARRLGVLIIP